MDESAASMTPVFAMVFDWGDTLMRVFPEYDGAMVDWPQVSAVDGAGKALEQLHGRFRLFVATNAAESSARQVCAALERVELAQYIERVFTMHELNSRKPDPAFFLALSEQIGVLPQDCVMVGDDLQVDIAGAISAGWRAMWLNPGSLPYPALLPLHDADIAGMDDLSAAQETLRLPRYMQCLQWLQSAGASHNLLAHVHTVAALAYQMALWIRNNGHAVDPILAHRGGLLHDLSKATSFQSPDHRLDHGEMAAQLLSDTQQPVLAEIARRHLLFRPLEPGRSPETIEQKLVFFMDKLVEHNRVVTLEERIHHLRQRYTLDPARLDALMPHLHTMQMELCSLAGLDPDDLIPRLQRAIY
jgi:putative nucleotidyltransferase with HDIG domain